MSEATRLVPRREADFSRGINSAQKPCKPHINIYFFSLAVNPAMPGGSSGFPELLGTPTFALQAIQDPLRGLIQPFGLILNKVATLNCGSGNPEP